MYHDCLHIDDDADVIDATSAAAVLADSCDVDIDESRKSTLEGPQGIHTSSALE